MENKTNKISADLKSKLIWSVVITCALIVGIPLLILGAVKGVWFLLAFGIACAVVGFYGTPLMWVSYAELRALKRVVDAVMEEHLNTVSEISSHLVLSERVAKQSVTKAINKKYITGYIFDGEKLVPNEKQAPKKKLVQTKCANCGGSLKEEQNTYVCEYCGSIFNKE